MKQVRYIIIVFLVTLISCPALVKAQQSAEETQQITVGQSIKAAKEKAGPIKERIFKRKTSSCGSKRDTTIPKLFSMLNQKQIVATKDGGVIIVVGNRLLKYDKSLNLLHEAELKIDAEGILSFMDQMQEQGKIYIQRKVKEQRAKQKE